ncbi:MAG TPA: RHS repeat-associated core domain-containing protein, partial [Pyrinomonadaceae bacterium]
TMGLTYNYGTTNNNGNLLSVSYSGGGLSYTQSFGYDQLNRLTTSNENSGSSWSETNGYDRYGNRWIDLGGGNQSLYFNTSNNRITTSGYAYDSAGNLTNDTLHTYGFDAENKIKTVDGVNDVYRYDGDGNRVRKNFASGEKVRMVYSGGQLIAEYDLSNGALKKEYVYGAKGLIATIEPANGTRYTTADHLGSPRVVTNSSAGVVSRHDYMPFGIEIGVTVGGRTAGMGYGATDNVRQKFTQKERDNETGLDYFLARYYSSSQGRFTGADPYNANLERRRSNSEMGEERFRRYLLEPSRWNQYTYALNNPLAVIDPDGRQPLTRTATEMTQSALRGLSRFARPAVAQEVATIVIQTVLEKALGPNIEVRAGGLKPHERAFAGEVSKFTGNSFLGTDKDRPGIDGVLTTPGASWQVKGVASLTETSRDNVRVLLDVSKDKLRSASNAGYQNVDLFIKATNIDSATALEYVQRGPGFTDITSGGTIRSINIFTNDNQVVRIAGNTVTTCRANGQCQ